MPKFLAGDFDNFDYSSIKWFLHKAIIYETQEPQYMPKLSNLQNVSLDIKNSHIVSNKQYLMCS